MAYGLMAVFLLLGLLALNVWVWTAPPIEPQRGAFPVEVGTTTRIVVWESRNGEPPTLNLIDPADLP